MFTNDLGISQGKYAKCNNLFHRCDNPMGGKKFLTGVYFMK
jgi:hypothetical protein